MICDFKKKMYLFFTEIMIDLILFKRQKNQKLKLMIEVFGWYGSGLSFECPARKQCKLEFS